jgi:acetyltransferase
MTGSYESFCAACKQFGAVIAGDLETLYDQAKALATIDGLDQGRIAVISSSGGANGIVADEAASLGLCLSAFPRGLVDELETLGLPPLAKLNNPVDLGSMHGEHYKMVGKLIAKHKAADLILMNFADPVHNTFEIVSELRNEINIPVAVAFMGGGKEEKINRVKLQRLGIPVFSSAARAIRGIHAVAWRTEYLRKNQSQDHRNVQKQRQTPRPASKEPYFLLETEAVKFLAEYNIPYPPNGFARNVTEAQAVASRIGYPVVLKVVSKDVSHKSDAGGVLLGIKTPDELTAGYERIIDRVGQTMPSAEIEGMLVCEHVSQGLEVIVGVTQDANYGPIMMFGLGGIYTEIYRDVAFRLAPLSRQNAEEMIREIKGFPILAGTRGHSGYDIGALVKLIISVSRLAVENQNIQELDLNPIRIFEKGLMALDIRIIE